MKEGWKKSLIKAAGFGAGFALMLAVVAGGVAWYIFRPKHPKPWNQTAIVARESPNFGVSGDGKRLKFSYSVENTTSTDYQLESNTQIRVMLRVRGGTLTPPLSVEVAPLELPIFIPAKQKGGVTLSLVYSAIPGRKSSESNDLYYERLRAYFQERPLGKVDSFVLFDETNRYQINLPPWSSESRKKNP